MWYNLKDVTKCEVDILRKLLHEVIDEICGRGAPAYETHKDVWDLEQWWNVTSTIRDIYKITMKNDWNKDQLNEKLDSISNEHKQAIIECLWLRHEELRQGLINRVASITSTQLVDFDWQAKLVLSSDKVSHINQPLVSLDLYTEEAGQTKSQTVELTKQDLSTLITSLDEANKVLQQLKT
eukprot:GHVT01098638.1.p1 GENE.GHVT01098638.1~~GHVT01098638.1.p1  ORF type:complete len:181 (+),score=5.84 GHVT01098638.1:48-590(+)